MNVCEIFFLALLSFGRNSSSARLMCFERINKYFTQRLRVRRERPENDKTAFLLPFGYAPFDKLRIYDRTYGGNGKDTETDNNSAKPQAANA